MEYGQISFDSVADMLEQINRKHANIISSEGLKNLKEPFTMADHLHIDDQGSSLSIYTIYERGKKKYRILDFHCNDPPQTIWYDKHGKIKSMW